jgi:hypothetical protein
MIAMIKDILQLPERCLVNRKITKAFFKRNFDLSSVEKSLLDDTHTVMGIDWIASLNADNTNIPGYTHTHCSYEEIQVIAVETGRELFMTKNKKVTELVQKYIPYHLICIVYEQEQHEMIWSVATKKINENDRDKRVIEQRYFTEPVKLDQPTASEKAFSQNMAYERQDKTNMKCLYESYISGIVALQTVAITGVYEIRTAARTKKDVEHLAMIDKIDKEIHVIQQEIKKEVQLNRKVAMNMEIQKKKNQIAVIKSLINTL